MYILYLLENTCNNRTYVGITNNPKRRLRQHNGEIKGGARYTKMHKGTGKWFYHTYIENLSKSQALSFERMIKNKKMYKIKKRANEFSKIKKKLETQLKKQ